MNHTHFIATHMVVLAVSFVAGVGSALQSSSLLSYPERLMMRQLHASREAARRKQDANEFGLKQPDDWRNWGDGI